MSTSRTALGQQARATEGGPVHQLRGGLVEFVETRETSAQRVTIHRRPSRPSATTRTKDLGADRVALVRDPESGEIIDHQDNRTEDHYRSDHIRKMPSVVRALVEGRAGVLNTSAAEADGGIGSLEENLLLGVPLASEMLQEGDGAGEAMIATAAAAAYQMGSRAAGLLNIELSRVPQFGATQRARELGKLHATLMKGAAALEVALERVRALKRTPKSWEKEIDIRKLVVDAVEEDDEGEEDGGPIH
ncbi:MAG: hypothetical protein HY905_03935 [Deltaproteobacteria bacterium]|nr:hypothetical protein [Deltaproteobacteria bacterium]